jgi:hypothetical protein
MMMLTRTATTRTGLQQRQEEQQQQQQQQQHLERFSRGTAGRTILEYVGEAKMMHLHSWLSLLLDVRCGADGFIFVLTLVIETGRLFM